MPSDPLEDAIYVKVDATIEDNYRGADGSYPVSPSAVASLATRAALVAIEEQGYAIVPTSDLARAFGDAVMLHAERGYSGSGDYLSRLGPFLRAALPDAAARPSVPSQSVVDVTGGEEATGETQGAVEALMARADRMAEMVIEKDREATQWAERLHKAEAALVHAKALHSRDDSNPHGPWCGTCTTHWPCQTWTALLPAGNPPAPRELEAARAAIARVRRLCELTIAASCRVQAIDQARDTLAALDSPEEP